MINSSNSFQSNKLLIFHGLNNNIQAFSSLKSAFEGKGFDTEIIVLPCHGDNRAEARDTAEAIGLFTKQMKRFEGQSYHAIAFSHGALYLQLWMENQVTQRPLKQVLLAPALYLRRQHLIEKAMKLLPPFVRIMSLQPRRFRRYNMLSAREYNILVQGIVKWQKIKRPFRIPTQVYIDPLDELVNADQLKEDLEKISGLTLKSIDRPERKLGVGGHHIVFHPDYFLGNEWEILTEEIAKFLRS